MGKNSLKKVLLRKIPVQLATEATIRQDGMKKHHIISKRR